MTRLRKFLISLDQFVGSLLFNGIGPDETISAYVWRRDYQWRIKAIDFFFGKDHCRNSYIAEKTGKHLAPEYRETFDEESA